jgi:hypothetical protein
MIYSGGWSEDQPLLISSLMNFFNHQVYIFSNLGHGKSLMGPSAE